MKKVQYLRINNESVVYQGKKRPQRQRYGTLRREMLSPFADDLAEADENAANRCMSMLSSAAMSKSALGDKECGIDAGDGFGKAAGVK